MPGTKSNIFDKGMHNGFVVNNDMRAIGDSVDGAESKFFIKYNGRSYLVKDSSFNPRRKQKSLAPYCEYVGSNFIKNCGLLECQETFLGKYDGRDVVICSDLFSDKDGTFRPFKELHQSSAGTDLGNKFYTYDDVLYILEKKSELSGSEIDDYKHHFWLMFLFDTILGNRDRHEGNWGFWKCDGKTMFAPVFDNGSSLFPDVDLSKWNDYDFIKERVYRMPVSQFKMWKPGITDRPMRTNFYEILRDFRDEFADELEEVRGIDFDFNMCAALRDVPSFCKGWFATISKFRFECLIMGRDFNEVWEDYQNDWNREFLWNQC